jgi:hypothetical protein
MIEGKNAIILLILLYHNKLLNRIAIHSKTNLKANIRGQNMRKVIDIQMKFFLVTPVPVNKNGVSQDARHLWQRILWLFGFAPLIT